MNEDILEALKPSTKTSLLLAGCVTLDQYDQPNLESVCRRLDPDQQIITFFAENYTPINCRSSMEGVFHFAYQVRLTRV